MGLSHWLNIARETRGHWATGPLGILKNGSTFTVGPEAAREIQLLTLVLLAAKSLVKFFYTKNFIQGMPPG